MSELKWLIDKRIIDISESDIVGKLKSLNYSFEVKDYNNTQKYSYGDISTMFRDDEPLMMLGTIKFVSDHQKVPNPFGSLFWHKNVDIIDTMWNFNQDEISKYFLNSEFKITYLSELVENIEKYLDVYDSFFVRPNSSLKAFSGVLITKDNYLEEINFIVKNQRACGKTLCVVSPFKNIIDETRFIILNDDVVGSSKYIMNGKVESSEGSSSQAMDLAKTIARHKWKTKPDIAYILDIAETNDEVKVIELNCYSTSGFYKCKTDHIEFVNDAILAELNEQY